MNFRQLPPRDLAIFLQDHPDAILLDVREPWEFALATLEGSTLIPLGQLADRAEEELPNEPGKPIIAYCHHGIRSINACAVLSALGYGELFNLSGGIDRYSMEVGSVPRY
ncbi:MAG: putative rhodanese-related sulfurtransferase [Chlorobi bacterium]|nr:putative rhodanese-related sulfurtransferase [Chlorobiota bacterium]